MASDFARILGYVVSLDKIAKADVISISVDRSAVPPILRINGLILPFHLVKSLPKTHRQTVRNKLANIDKKLVAYTMKGAKLPSAK